MAELECKLAERETFCFFLPRRIRNWFRSKAFLEIHIHLHVLFFQLHEHPLTFSQLHWKRPTRGFPHLRVLFHFQCAHPSTSESASLYKPCPRMLLIVHPRLRPPLYFLLDPHVFALPSSSVPGNPDFLRTASCDPVPYLNANTFPAHLYSSGPVYTHATQALGSIGSANYTTLFCNTSAGAQTPFPLVEDPRHFPPSP